MEFLVKINGVEFVEFDLKDPVKAAELVNTLTMASTGCGVKKSEQNVFGDPEHGTIDHVLTGLRGTKTSKFIKVLASLEDFGGTDGLIKQKMSEGMTGEINLAPFIASISKACKRGGVETAEVLIRNEKRIRANKVRYYYKLTAKAAAFVNSIDDFEKDEYFESDPYNSSEYDEEESDQIDSPDEETQDTDYLTGSNRS